MSDDSKHNLDHVIEAKEHAQKYGFSEQAVIYKIRAGIVSGFYHEGKWYVKEVSHPHKKDETKRRHGQRKPTPEEIEAYYAQNHSSRVEQFLNGLLLFVWLSAMFYINPITGESGKRAFSKRILELFDRLGIPYPVLWLLVLAWMGLLLYLNRRDFSNWRLLHTQDKIWCVLLVGSTLLILLAGFRML